VKGIVSNPDESKSRPSHWKKHKKFQVRRIERGTVGKYHRKEKRNRGGGFGGSKARQRGKISAKKKRFTHGRIKTKNEEMRKRKKKLSRKTRRLT